MPAGALREWAAGTAITDVKAELSGVLDLDGLEELQMALRHAYRLPEPAGESFKEARFAVGLPLHRVSY
ncbi:hypothetical protein [Streptomyces sp. A0592]|uniref:hypothetical protein n=1 Tax=Streptomyces sp. A0592 TaxID=2563099 RepID=UPI00109E7982|nr:hypothetical protein [Streptomyces sp. A0592]THA77823.1 hypothetical protein E6U81_34225 [Streptomyces sp. A0592]